MLMSQLMFLFDSHNNMLINLKMTLTDFHDNLKIQGLSQNNVDHCENGHKTLSIDDVKYSVM